MAIWKEPTQEQRDGFSSFIATLPEYLQGLAEKYPPWTLYRLKANGARVYIVGYGQDTNTNELTFAVRLDAQFNAVVLEKTIVGVPPDHLEECDLPGPDEPVGTLEDMVEAGISATEGTIN